MSVVETLRARTAEAHGRVDAAFRAYELTDGGSYCRFLLAHAHALVAAETFRSRGVAAALAAKNNSASARRLGCPWQRYAELVSPHHVVGVQC